jgi:hypothetical protein
MPSPPDSATSVAPGARRAADAFLVWNRRIHYFLGLYLLFFTWLFTFTGLLLNHPRWTFAEFWPNRVQSTNEHQIRATAGMSSAEQARDLMRQLGIAGEIQWPGGRPAAGMLAFQVSRPGLVIEVTADLRSERVTLRRNALNAWGVMHFLHIFTGMPAASPANERDWVLTTVWALSMDGVAAGLIVMVLSSYIMWYRLKTKRLWGTIALLLGFVSSALLMAGVRWLS